MMTNLVSLLLLVFLYPHTTRLLSAFPTRTDVRTTLCGITFRHFDGFLWAPCFVLAPATAVAANFILSPGGGNGTDRPTSSCNGNRKQRAAKLVLIRYRHADGRSRDLQLAVALRCRTTAQRQLHFVRVTPRCPTPLAHQRTNRTIYYYNKSNPSSAVITTKVYINFRKRIVMWRNTPLVGWLQRITNGCNDRAQFRHFLRLPLWVWISNDLDRNTLSTGNWLSPVRPNLAHTTAVPRPSEWKRKSRQTTVSVAQLSNIIWQVREIFQDDNHHPSFGIWWGSFFLQRERKRWEKRDNKQRVQTEMYVLHTPNGQQQHEDGRTAKAVGQK